MTTADDKRLQDQVNAANNAGADECTCPYTDPSTWLSAASCGYGSGYEPGSMQEWNPDCPVHPADDTPPDTRSEVETLAEGDENIYSCAGCDAKVDTENDAHIGWAWGADDIGEMFCAFCVGVSSADDTVRIVDGTLRRHAVKRAVIESLTLICLCDEEMSPLVHRQHQAREVAMALSALAKDHVSPARHDADIAAAKAAGAAEALRGFAADLDESAKDYPDSPECVRGLRVAAIFAKATAIKYDDLRAALMTGGEG